MEKLLGSQKDIILLLKKGRFLDDEEKAHQATRKDPNNAELFFLKGAANLFMNRIEDGLMDFGEALYLNPQHIPSMHGVAYILLKKEDFAGALNKWISILEIDPKDKLAKKNSGLFKKKALDKAAINMNPYLFIPLPKAVPSGNYNKAFKITAIFAASILLLFSVFWLYNFFSGKPFKALPDFSNLTNKEVLYSFTEKEIDFYKKEIFDLVNLQKYNQSKMLMNKFYLSNASLEDKKLVKTWEARLEYPNAEKLDQNFTPEEVFTNPKLFLDCFVSWSGEISTITQKSKYLFLEIKVNENQIIGVSFFSNYPLAKGNSIQFLGKISSVKKDSIEVEAFSLEKK